LIPNDTIHLDVINTGIGFTVSSQNSSGIVYEGGSSQTITWNLANTVEAPINAANVEIYMSVDGGYNWMYHIGTYENTGSATVIVPNPAISTSTARFKVKGADNVFFNINGANFTVNYDASKPISAAVANPPAPAESFNIFPVPAHDIIYFNGSSSKNTTFVCYNFLGQKVWEGAEKTVDVSRWPKGCYFAGEVVDGRLINYNKFILY
jgi:hypothetical protein